MPIEEEESPHKLFLTPASCRSLSSLSTPVGKEMEKTNEMDISSDEFNIRYRSNTNAYVNHYNDDVSYLPMDDFEENNGENGEKNMFEYPTQEKTSQNLTIEKKPAKKGGLKKTRKEGLDFSLEEENNRTNSFQVGFANKEDNTSNAVDNISAFDYIPSNMSTPSYQQQLQQRPGGLKGRNAKRPFSVLNFETPTPVKMQRKKPRVDFDTDK
jgi:hypothetical protein